MPRFERPIPNNANKTTESTMKATNAKISAKNALPQEVPYSDFTAHNVTMKLKIIPRIPSGPRSDPKMALSTIMINTPIIALPNEALSIPANLVPNHKNIASRNTSATKPIIPISPNAAIAIKSIIFITHR